MKAIEVCTNRFDDDTKNSFTELYTKVDAVCSAEQIQNAKDSRCASQTNEEDESSDDVTLSKTLS